MKKIFSIIAMIALTLTLTGCGNKITEVTCTKSIEVPNTSTASFTYHKEKATFTFKGNKVTKYFIETTVRYKSESRANELAQDFQLSASQNKTNGITREYKTNGNELISKIIVIREDITDKEIIKETYLINKYDEIIKEYKENEYTCTTK